MKKIAKRGLSLLLCLAMVFGFVVTATGPLTVATANSNTKAENKNLLEGMNPSFETTAAITGWSGTGIQSTEAAKDGAYSLKIHDSSTTNSYRLTSDHVTAFTVGKTYVASVQAKGTAVPTLTLVFYNSTNGRVATKTVEGKAQNSWQTITVELEAPKGAVKAAVVLGTTAASKGDAYFDMAALREKGATVEKPVDPEITNGNFEGAFDATTKLPAGWVHEADNTNREKVTSGGNSVLQMSATASSKCGINTGNFKVTPGTVYVASVDAKKISGDAQVTLNLYLAKSATDNTTNTVLSLPFALNGNGWETLYVTAFVPTGYTHARFSIQLSGADGVVQLDNVTVDIAKDGTVPNTSFEGATTSSALPNGWIKGPMGGATTQLLSSDEARTGSQSLLLSKTSSNGDAISGFIPVTPGETYQASVWIKGDSVTSIAQFALYAITKDDVLSNGQDGLGSIIDAPVITPTATWTQYTITYTVPADVIAVRMRMFTRGSVNGDVYYDDVSLVMEKNMASNPSFESWPTGWLNYNNFERLEGDGTDGNFYIKCKEDVRSCTLYQKDINVKPWSTYRLEVDYKLLDGALRGYVKIIAGSASNVAFGEVADGKWHTMSIDLQIPDDATTARIDLGCDLNTAGEVLLDNVRFTLVDTPDDAPTAANLLTNVSFEARNPIPSWIISGQTNVAIMQNNSNASDGQYSLTLTDNGKWIWTEKVPVVAGKNYRASVDALGVAASQLIIRFYADEADTAAFTNGATNVMIFDDWETTILDCKAPEGAKYADVLICTTGAAKGTTYVDNVKLFQHDIVYSQLLANPSLEDLNSGGFPRNWSLYNTLGKYTITDKEEDVWDGKYAIRVEDFYEDNNCGILSDPIAVTPGKTYVFSCMAKEDKPNTYFNPAIWYFDANGNNIGAGMGESTGSGTWAICYAEALCPDNAVYARLLLSSGRANVGSVVYDALSFGENAMPEIKDVSPDWEIIESGHPRLFFSKDELAERRAFAKDTTVNPFGYSGKEAADFLIRTADGYVDDAVTGKHFYTNEYNVIAAPNCKNFNPETGIAVLDWGSWDKIRDASNEEVRKSVGWPISKLGYPDYPIDQAYTFQLRDRMKTLALAYAITGDTKYSDWAISYAMDMSKWEWWSSAESTSMGVNYILNGICPVFDMCYDQMTKAERETIETAIIERGIKDLNRGLGNRVFHNFYANYTAGVLLGVATVIDEDNKDELIPYLNTAYNYARWFINCLENSGQQEGYLYTDHSVECMVASFAALKRVTGDEGLIGGTYFSDLLVPWVVNFSAPISYDQPAFSDSNYASYFPITMSVLNKEMGNGLAGWYLSKIGGPADAYEKFLYAESDPVITEPTSFVTHVQEIGYGALRTGFEDNDMLLTMIANNSNFGHNQYDQNSFQLAAGGSWLASDPGYTTTGTSKEYTDFSEYQGHNTILVDNATQVIRGRASMSSVFESGLYGYIIGSAAEAYGYDGKRDMLDKFDRHAIMVNHANASYYVLLDDLDSFKDRTYTWNMYNKFQGITEVDGKILEKNQTIKGNQVSIEQGSQILRVNFAGAPIDIESFMWEDAYGPMIRAHSPKADDYQFLTVLNVTSNMSVGSQLFLFDAIFKGASSATFNNTPGEINWYTSSKISDDMTKIVEGSTVYFRGDQEGDWISFPFTVEADGTYDVTAKMLACAGYGTYQLYIDDVAYGDPFDGFNTTLITKDHSMGSIRLTAGEHTLKLVLCDKKDDTDFIGITGLMLQPDIGDDDGGLPDNTIQITQSFDTQSVKGAVVSYAADRSDIILFNRGAKSISAADVVTDGTQVSILGVDTNGNIVDGFAVTNATTLTYKGQTLLKAEKPVDIVVDFASGEVKIEAHSDVKQNVTFYIGNGNYNVNMNGVTLKDHMVSMTLNKGKTTFSFTCNHAFDQEVAATDYLFALATCTEKAQYYKTCVCGAIGEEIFEYGEAAGHDWRDAICYAPKTCFVCRITEGEALGHDWVDATCTTPQTCTRCPMVGQLALGHNIVEVLDEESGEIICWTCTTCGACFSDPDGMNEIPNMDSSTSPDSGGNGMLIFIIVVAALVVIAGAVAIILIVKKKRGNTEAPTEDTTEDTQE